MFSLMTEEWQERMIGVQYSISDIAKTAQMSVSAASKIMTGESKNPGILTVKKLEEALDRLRGTCPCCGQKLPQEVPRYAPIRKPR